MLTTALRRRMLWVGAVLAPGIVGLPCRATVLDGFESTAGWTTVADAAGSTVTISTMAVDSSGNDALQMNYSLALGNYAGIYNDTFGYLNLNELGANAVQFSYRAGSLPNTIQIQLTDSDFPDPGQSTKKVYTFIASADDAWHTLVVPLSQFATWTNTGLGGATNSAVFDLSKVSHLSFGVTKNDGVAGSDSVRFDNFSLYRLDGPVPLVNGYETFAADCWVGNTCTNDRPTPKPSFFFSDVPSSGSSLIVSTESSPGSGTHSREIRYTIPSGGGYVGLSEALENVSVVGTDRIEFYVKGAAGSEPLKIQLKSEGMVCFSSGLPCPTLLAGPSAITTGWQKFSIPFSSFVGVPGAMVPDLDVVSEIVFLLETADTSGRVYIDDLEINRPAADSSVVKVLEDFTVPKLNLGYGVYPSTDAQLSFNFEQDSSIGVSTNVVGRLDYVFAVNPSTPYAVVERPLGVNLLAEPVVRFRYKGTGANSDVEVKLKDADGTVYRKVVADASNTGGSWRSATIPVDQFSFVSLGADSSLTLTRISQMEFILSRGQAAPGTFTLDSLESGASVAMSKTGVGSLLTGVSTPDNPFTPNGDGLADVFRVNYTLTESATVVFKVFNLQGVPVKTIDAGNQAAGALALSWDGYGDDGRQVANGIYFFTLEAEGVFAGKETFRQVVGVMR